MPEGASLTAAVVAIAALGDSLPAERPRLRGVLHQVAVFVAFFAACGLVLAGQGWKAKVAAGVYGFCLTVQLGISAAYHRREWGPVGWMRMRVWDHSAIFLLIAGTYTPVLMLGLPTTPSLILLTVLWSAVGVGTGQCILWPSAPKLLRVFFYVALGWLPAVQWSALELSTLEFMFFGLGGVIYTLGAVVYAFRIPNPAPRVFGYHEVFHALVVLAAGLHFVAITLLVLRV